MVILSLHPIYREIRFTGQNTTCDDRSWVIQLFSRYSALEGSQGRHFQLVSLKTQIKNFINAFSFRNRVSSQSITEDLLPVFESIVATKAKANLKFLAHLTGV